MLENDLLELLCMKKARFLLLFFLLLQQLYLYPVKLSWDVVS